MPYRLARHRQLARRAARARCWLGVPHRRRNRRERHAQSARRLVCPGLRTAARHPARLPCFASREVQCLRELAPRRARGHASVRTARRGRADQRCSTHGARGTSTSSCRRCLYAFLHLPRRPSGGPDGNSTREAWRWGPTSTATGHVETAGFCRACRTAPLPTRRPRCSTRLCPLAGTRPACLQM
jgi:hypothetical protein